MKKYGDLPVYFIIVGLMLNVIMYFYNQVSFEELMIRSIIVTIAFAGIGYFVAKVLNDAHFALEQSLQNKYAKESNQQGSSSTIDVRVDSDDEDELLRMIPQKEEDEFVEINPEILKYFANRDNN